MLYSHLHRLHCDSCFIMILQYGKNHKIGKFDSQCHKTIHKIRKFVLCSVSQLLAITKNYIYGKQM